MQKVITQTQKSQYTLISLLHNKCELNTKEKPSLSSFTSEKTKETYSFSNELSKTSSCWTGPLLPVFSRTPIVRGPNEDSFAHHSQRSE
jgi:hypothetical protein